MYKTVFRTESNLKLILNTLYVTYLNIHIYICVIPFLINLFVKNNNFSWYLYIINITSKF